jgi:multicomponent Na+:H+ antiporter subunit G
VTVRDWLALPLLAGGAFFFLAGTVGLLRFPDLYTRLHALTKADNLGLGLVVLGLAVRASSPAIALKLVLIWVLAMGGAAASAQAISRAALRAGIAPWRRR